MSLQFIQTSFENASPLDWETDADGRVHIGLLYDHERGSRNRAAGHWHFQLQAAPGSDLRLVLHNFDNVWNGQAGSPISERTSCHISTDDSEWRAIPMRKTADNKLEVTVHMDCPSLFLARLEPYRVSDLDRLLAEIRPHALVDIQPIGCTPEGQPLEIVRMGRTDAPFRVLLRARSHPWEPGGNWVVQGLIHALLEEDVKNRAYLDQCCVYVLPMADKDGVIRGRTRFNANGMDLNRNWEHAADPDLAPENAALETWLEGLIGAGLAPQLVIDLHNDNRGLLHVSRPGRQDDRHIAQMLRLEQLLRRHTWFTEGSKIPAADGPWTIGDGLLARYGIDACILELNCDWIAGLGKVPAGSDWAQFGRDLRAVFFDYAESSPKFGITD
jgi:hypothetical protein